MVDCSSCSGNKNLEDLLSTNTNHPWKNNTTNKQTPKRLFNRYQKYSTHNKWQQKEITQTLHQAQDKDQTIDKQK
jgi:hypothetical protein